MYGWLTNTGVKIVIVVDMEGRPATAFDTKAAAAMGLRDADFKPVSTVSPVRYVLLTLQRPSEHYKQRTLRYYEILSTTQMNIRQ